MTTLVWIDANNFFAQFQLTKFVLMYNLILPLPYVLLEVAFFLYIFLHMVFQTVTAFGQRVKWLQYLCQKIYQFPNYLITPFF